MNKLRCIKNEKNQLVIQSLDKEIPLETEEFEDLFYALPTSTTALYRILSESLCESQERQKELRQLLESFGPELHEILEAFQEHVRASKHFLT